MTRQDRIDLRRLQARKDKLVKAKKDAIRNKKTMPAHHSTRKLKRRITRIEALIVALNARIKPLNRKRHDAQQPLTSELQQRFNDAVAELTDVKQERDRLRKRLCAHQGLRDAVRSLLKALFPIERAALDSEGSPPKNLYSTTSASLWTDDLWNVREAMQALEEHV